MNMSDMAPDLIPSDAPTSVEDPQADHASKGQAKTEQLARISTFLSNVDTNEAAGCRTSMVEHMNSTLRGRLILESADTFHTGEYYAHQDQICEETPQAPDGRDAVAKANDLCTIIGNRPLWTKGLNEKNATSSAGRAHNRTKSRRGQIPSAPQQPKMAHTELTTMRRSGKEWTER